MNRPKKTLGLLYPPYLFLTAIIFYKTIFKRMNILRPIYYILCFILLIIPTMVMAQSAPLYRCGIALGFPPYQYVDKKGNPAGIDYEVASLVFKTAGLNVKFIQDEWEYLFSSITHKLENIDMLCGAEVSPERIGLVDFSVPYYKRHIVVFTLKNSPLKGFTDLYGKVVAGDRHSYIEERLGKRKEEIRIMKTSSKEDSFKKLKEGQVVAVIAPLEVGVFLSHQLDIPVKLIGEKDPGTPVAIAVSKGNKDLLIKINEALEKIIKEGKIEKILKEHRDY